MKATSEQVHQRNREMPTIVLGAEDDRADRARDVVKGERVAIAIDVGEDGEREHRDGDVRDDEDDEEERDEAGGEEGDHCLQRETTGRGD